MENKLNSIRSLLKKADLKKADQTAPFRLWLFVGLLAMATGIVLSILFLNRLPRLDTLDELHNWVVQWTYARTGLLGDWFYRQMIPLPQPIYDTFHIPAALLLRLIGDSFWQARLARFLLTLIALPFIYKSGEMLYGKRTGLFACAIAFFFMIPINYVRPDFGVGIMLSIGLYCFLLAEKHNRPILHYLTGLMIGLGGEGHPLAYRFGVAFGLIYGIRWLYEIYRRKRIFFDGHVFAIGMGGATAILIYVAIHLLPGLEQGLHFAKSYSPAGQTVPGQLQAATEIISRQFEVWNEFHPAEQWIFAAGIVLAVFRFHRGDRLILFILLVAEVLMLATYGYYRAVYQIHFLPLFVLLMGKALADGFDFRSDPRPAEGNRWRLAFAALIFTICSAVMINRGLSEADPMREEFEDIGRQFAATFPPNVRVMANEDYFLTYTHPDFYGISTIATPAWFIVDLQDYALMEATAPDVIVLTPELDWPKYVPFTSIYEYIGDKGFQLVRCYTATGKATARVYMKEPPQGWKDTTLGCRRWGGEDNREPAIDVRAAPLHRPAN
jgi:hypothetical protein